MAGMLDEITPLLDRGLDLGLGFLELGQLDEIEF
jgi:hypothetical protein